MERKVYIIVCGLVALAAFALAMHVLRIEDSVPAMVKLRGRHYSSMVSRDSYVHALLLDAVLLPVLCALFAYVAHAGREIDALSWVFVGSFFVALWWLKWEVDHAYQIDTRMPGISVGSVSNPAYMLGFAIVAGLGFWKFKQDWAREISPEGD